MKIQSNPKSESLIYQSHAKHTKVLGRIKSYKVDITAIKCLNGIVKSYEFNQN